MPTARLRPRQKWTLVLLALAALTPIIPSVIYGFRAAWVDAATAGARRVVDGWRGNYSPLPFTHERWEQTRATLQEGTRLDPANAQVRMDLAYLHIAPANLLETVAEPGSPLAQYRSDLIDQALGHYRIATQLRPFYPYSWCYLALAKHKRAQSDQEMWTAFDHALRLGHNEGGVQLCLAEVAFAHWPQLAPERKAHIQRILQSPNQEVKKDMQQLATRYHLQSTD